MTGRNKPPPVPPPIPPPIPSGPAEMEREELETAFTPILRKLRESTPRLLCAAFVDMEGECVDYVTRIDPFEAKVAGAHMLVLVSQLCEQHAKLGLAEPILMEIIGEERELWGRRVSDEYLLVTVLLPGVDRAEVRAELTAAGRAFRQEADLPVPSWEPSGRIEVVVRSAVGWNYAPASFNDGGIKVTIADVLGRWSETGDVAGEEIVCFRVRTEDGQELTLVHDPMADGWMVRA